MTTGSFSFFRLFLIVVIAFSSTQASAKSNKATTSDTINVSIPDIAALPGETIRVPIVTSFVEIEDSITSLEGSITCDTTIFTLLDLEREQTLTETWTLLDPMFNVIGNSALIAFPGLYPIQGSGALLLLVFQVSDDADIGQTTLLEFNRFTLNEGRPVSITQNALFTVGESPLIELSNREHNFGTVDIGDANEWPFLITNHGSADLHILDIHSDFTQFTLNQNVLPIILQTGESQEFRTAFQPTTEDTLENRFRVTSNDPQEPIAIISLTGAGRDTGTPVQEHLELNQLPERYELFQNYPNPFNPSTVIRYHIPNVDYPVHTSLKVFNCLGQKLRTLVDGIQEPGYYAVTWDAHDGHSNAIPSGVYFYTLEAGDFLATKRMVYIR